MKHKRLDRDLWYDITKKRYIQNRIENSFFSGLCSVVYIDGVKNVSVWEVGGQSMTVCDVGIKWLQILPDRENYMITAMMNAREEIVLWYIDMIASNGFERDGVAFYDDLYLDLVVRPDGYIKVDDMDELLEALATGDITEELVALALDTKSKLERETLSDMPRFIEYCHRLLRIIENGQSCK